MGRFLIERVSMNILDRLDFVAPDATFYESQTSSLMPLDYSKLFEASAEADMKTLDDEVLNEHLLGKTLIGTFLGPYHQVIHRDVLAYAGITGVEEVKDQQLAVVGGLVVDPINIGYGLGLLTVHRLLAAASTRVNRDMLGHQGYVARCNKYGASIFKKLGFTTDGFENGKEVLSHTGNE
jgi:hypothetical protein